MLFLLLALGLCTSVLVAWAGALVDRGGWPDTLLTRSPVGTRTAMRGWLVEQGRDRSLTWRTFAALDLHMEPPDLDAPTGLPAWSVGRALADQPGPFVPARERTRLVAWEVSAGWPARCVRAVRGAGPSEFALPGEFVRGGLAAMAYGWPMPAGAVARADGFAVAPWPAGGRAAVVPLRPMVGGLVVNTVAFALAWAAALAPLVVLRPLRRRRRRTKNRCVACGHAREGLPSGAPCAECGRDPNARTPARELLTARAPMLGAALALPLVLGASAALPTHRWMAVDRLPPLHHAAAVGDVEEVERLVAAGEFVLSPCPARTGWGSAVEGTTALHWAAARGHTEAAVGLIGHGASPVGNGGPSAPIALAIRRGDEGAVRALLPYLPRDEPDWFACMWLPGANVSLIRLMLETRWPSLPDRLEAAGHAIEDADIELYDMLLKPLPDLYAGVGKVFLADAVRSDARAWREPWRHDLGITAAVLERATATDQRTLDDFLMLAVRGGVTPAVSALIDAGAEPWPAFMHDAITYGDPTMIAVLAQAGVSVETGDPMARSGLWRAAELVRPGFVQAFLDAGADPTFEVDGETAAQMLARVRARAEADPAGYAHSPYLADRDAVARILDLLETAELEWSARAGTDAAPPAPGGR
jgi:hypothetical protein